MDYVDNAKRVMKENVELMMRKSEDYGNENLVSEGIFGIKTRLVDKIARVKNLIENDQAANFESLEDTFKDISNYGVLGQLMMRGEIKNPTNMVYLAGPIDGSYGVHYHRNSEIVLNYYNIGVFNPFTAYRLPNKLKNCAKIINDINKHAIKCCDLVLVYLPLDVPTIGTIREIEFAKIIGKSIIVVCPEGDNFLSLYDVDLCNNLPEAWEKIVGHDIDFDAICINEE